MALTAADFQAGAKVVEQSTVTAGGKQVYLRRFGTGARISGLPLLTVVDELLVFSDAGASAHEFVAAQTQLATKSGRSSFAKEFARDFVAGSKGRLKVTKTVVGAATALDSGSLWLPVTLTTDQGTLPIAIDVVQVDRVVSLLFLSGMFGQKLARSDAVRAAASMEARLRTAFTVASSQAPTVSGQAQQGQTLTVDEGSWSGAPSGFSYSWARCDATGGTCTPVGTATDKTYTLTAADSGFTIRVTVTGSNAVSSQQAVSSPTAAVP